MIWLAAILGGYLCGSIPVAYILGKYRLGLDIREHGSGNVGATNLWRVGGWRLGLLCFTADLLKGYFPVAAALIYSTERLAILAGAAAVLGHMYTIWLKGSGGKGVATAAGAFLGLAPFPLLYAVVTFIIVGPIATRTVSAGSVAAAVALIFSAVMRSSTEVAAIAAIIGGLTIYRHRGNMRRLYDGTESRIWSGLDS